MSLTLALFEKELVRRRGPMIVACDMSLTPKVDTSPRDYLASPIARALRAIGQAGNPTDPGDVDLANVAIADYDATFDCADLFLLESIVGNFIQVDYTSGQDGRKFTQLRESVEKLLDWKRRQIQADHPQVKLGELAKGA